MPREHLDPPEQFPLHLPEAERIEAEVERRVMQRCESETFLWRFRLIATETLMMGTLVGIAGVLLHQKIELVARAVLLIAGSCFGTGMLLLGLSGAGLRARRRFTKWWHR